MPRSLQILPETHELGSLDPHTLVLELPLYPRPAVEASVAGGIDNQPAQILAHEVRHWTDLVGTVWGQQYLDSLFLALDAAVNFDDDVSNYRHFIDLFDQDRSILFPTYYKIVNPMAIPTSDKRPWAISFTCGARIDPWGKLDEAQPIFFVRFDEKLAGPLTARQPMTIGALLELRATAAEISTFEDWVSRLPLDEQIASTKLFRRDRISSLYHPQLTTYSVASHLLSHCKLDHDVMTTYRIGATIAGLCLNMTRKQFAGLRPPAEFRKFDQIRLGGFRRNNDRGYAFACIAFKAREMAVRQLDPSNLDYVLSKIGLGTTEDIYVDALRELQRPTPFFTQIKDVNLRRIRQNLLDFGKELLMHRHLSWPLDVAELIRYNLPSPLVMTGDCEEFNLTSRGLSSADSNLLHKANRSLRDLTRNALRAARGFDFGFEDYVY